MIATILSVSPNQVKFVRHGEDLTRSHMRLNFSPYKFPFDALVPGQTYVIISSYENNLHMWVEAYQLGPKVQDVQLTKPRIS